MTAERLPDDILTHVINVALTDALAEATSTTQIFRPLDASDALLHAINTLAPICELSYQTVKLFVVATIEKLTVQHTAARHSLTTHKAQGHEKKPATTLFSSFGPSCVSCSQLTQSKLEVEDLLRDLLTAHQKLLETIKYERAKVRYIKVKQDIREKYNWSAAKEMKKEGKMSALEIKIVHRKITNELLDARIDIGKVDMIQGAIGRAGRSRAISAEKRKNMHRSACKVLSLELSETSIGHGTPTAALGKESKKPQKAKKHTHKRNKHQEYWLHKAKRHGEKKRV